MGRQVDKVDRYRRIIELDSELQTTQDLDILLQKILYEARRLVNADAGTIYLKKGNTLVFSYTQNETKKRELPPGQKMVYSFFTVEINTKSIAGYVAETEEILNIPTCTPSTTTLPTASTTRSISAAATRPPPC